MTQFPHLWNGESERSYFLRAEVKMEWVLSAQVSPNKPIIQTTSDQGVFKWRKVGSISYHNISNLITPNSRYDGSPSNPSSAANVWSTSDFKSQPCKSNSHTAWAHAVVFTVFLNPFLLWEAKLCSSAPNPKSPHPWLLLTYAEIKRN